MGKGRKRNKNKCRFIEDEADLSGDGHSEDGLSNDEEELERQKLFVDDSEVKERRTRYSPVHESEEELDPDDLALIEENEQDTVIVRRRKVSAIESSEDENHDSMEDFIEHDTDEDETVVVKKPTVKRVEAAQEVREVKLPAVKRVEAAQEVREVKLPAVKRVQSPYTQEVREANHKTARATPNARRPISIMPSYSNFRTPFTEEKQQQPKPTWDFMKKQAAAKPKPQQQAGYVRSADGLKYRKVDGTMVPATGVDRI
jgi:hypothetical protein